jgi:hypothetical protein
VLVLFRQQAAMTSTNNGYSSRARSLSRSTFELFKLTVFYKLVLYKFGCGSDLSTGGWKINIILWCTLIRVPTCHTHTLSGTAGFFQVFFLLNSSKLTSTFFVPSCWLTISPIVTYTAQCWKTDLNQLKIKTKLHKPHKLILSHKKQIAFPPKPRLLFKKFFKFNPLSAVNIE